MNKTIVKSKKKVVKIVKKVVKKKPSSTKFIKKLLLNKEDSKIEEKNIIKLPKKFKADWLKALRSGKYKQTTAGNLLDEQGYCCLGLAGVVCEVGKKHLRNRGFLTMVKHIKNTDKRNIAFNKIRTRIPKALRDDEDLQTDLATMNDGGKSFKEIAKYIQKNL